MLDFVADMVDFDVAEVVAGLYAAPVVVGDAVPVVCEYAYDGVVGGVTAVTALYQKAFLKGAGSYTDGFELP